MQCNLTNIINMDHIQTQASILSTVESTTRLRQVREKWCAMFHTCIKLFHPTPVYEYIYYLSGHKWSTTHKVLKSHRKKTDVICVQSCPPCYRHNGVGKMAWAHDEQCCNRTSGAQVHDLPQSHCGNREGKLFWLFWLHIYMYVCIYIYISWKTLLVESPWKDNQ